MSIAEALGALIAALCAFFAWLDSRSARKQGAVADEVKHGVEPISKKIDLLAQRFDDYTARAGQATEIAIDRGVRPLGEKIVALETKVDVFWRAVALDAAKILHQPDPARHMIDHLLESFMEDTLTYEEELQLRKYLVIIRNWEPGHDAGFPVHPGEQTAAAILLRTMSHAMTPRATSREGGHEG